MNKRAIAYLAKMQEVRAAQAKKADMVSEAASPVTEIRQDSMPNNKITPSKQITQEVKEFVDKQFFHKCDNCNAPIFYDPLYLDDFTGRYIPLSALTHRSHNCSRRKREKLESLIT